MILPKRLKAGDTIGFVAPSNVVTDYKFELLENGRKYLESFGLQVVHSPNFRAVDSTGENAGTPQERADDINEFFADKSVDAIWCVQGGSTAKEVLDLLDFELIKRNPKLVLGMSDVDHIHIAVNALTDIITFNTPDPKFGDGEKFDFDYSKKRFKERLIDGKVGFIPKDSEWTSLRSGKASGRLLGCNITVLSNLVDTKYFPVTEKIVLFIESVGRTTRSAKELLVKLKSSGLFEKVNGVVLGHQEAFNEKNNKKTTFEEVFMEVVKEYSFPVLKIEEFGHKCPNAFLPIGGTVELDADKQEIRILEPYVS